jgi:hypothetical protein
MKLRIKGNSLRLRLTRSEIAHLADEGRLESETDFGNQTFRFAVVSREENAPLSSSFGSNSIVVNASRAAVAHWAESNDVGLYGEQPTSRDDTLTIAIEKDFRCLDPRRDEDESDNFDNPLAGESRHETCDAEAGTLPAR